MNPWDLLWFLGGDPGAFPELHVPDIGSGPLGTLGPVAIIYLMIALGAPYIAYYFMFGIFRALWYGVRVVVIPASRNLSRKFWP